MDKAYDRTPTIRARNLRNNPTEAESRLWAAIRNRQVGGFRFNRQVSVGHYICDFACRSAKLIVEVDGGQHAESPADKRRDAFLADHGYRVLRFWNNGVLANIDGVVSAIEQALPQPLPPAGGELANSPSQLGGAGEGLSK